MSSDTDTASEDGGDADANADAATTITESEVGSFASSIDGFFSAEQQYRFNEELKGLKLGWTDRQFVRANDKVRSKRVLEYTAVVENSGVHAEVDHLAVRSVLELGLAIAMEEGR